MSKPIRSYPESERYFVAKRRVDGRHGGLGYLSAVAYLERTSVISKGEKDTKKSQ